MRRSRQTEGSSMFSDTKAALVTVRFRGNVNTYKNCHVTTSDLTGSEIIRCNGSTVARYDTETGWTTNGVDSAHVTIA
jgi:hypothetical protein